MADKNKPSIPTVPLSQIEPGSVIINWDKLNPESEKKLDDIYKPRRPGERVHNKPEPELEYRKGGRVKYGSSTKVSCRNK